MKICSIDSSGLTASVAVTDDEITIAEYTIQHKITHSQTLLPMLDEMTARIGLELRDIDAYAVAAGPGSFTGLRIGIATVKGLAMVTDKPVAAIPTLEALAYNAYGAQNLVCPIMDARREQVYTGVYEFATDARMSVILGQSAIAFEELCERLNALGRPVMFIGDGIPVFRERMQGLTVDYTLAPVHMNRQRASALGALASVYFASDADGLEGHITTAQALTPIYLRLSQAEREKLAKEGAQP